MLGGGLDLPEEQTLFQNNSAGEKPDPSSSNASPSSGGVTLGKDIPAIPADWLWDRALDISMIQLSYRLKNVSNSPDSESVKPRAICSRKKLWPCSVLKVAIVLVSSRPAVGQSLSAEHQLMSGAAGATGSK
ncbi:hypothetical protein RRG08_049381 [Elysia crispata]|uniref:Uncharacterized protein n=1 Tax=Elysia crispata TaxID=231223 RepID=A0AAE0XDY1_9GAST|nr:hypothetical protein RRG08_049381 [Elysia crispata]